MGSQTYRRTFIKMAPKKRTPKRTRKTQTTRNKWLSILQTIFLYHAYKALSPTAQKLLKKVIIIFTLFAFLFISETGSILKKHISDTLYETSLELGFKTDKILIEERYITAEENLLSLLLPYKGTSIFALPLEDIRTNIETKIPWVTQAIIQRKFPDTLHVTLQEVTPLAQWKHLNKNYVITKEKTIAVKSLTPFSNLPLLEGKGANHHATDLFDELLPYPDLLNRIAKIERIEDRRWNLISDSDITIMLPAKNISQTLKKLDDTIKQDDILDKRITKLDLRLSDRVIVKPIKKP